MADYIPMAVNLVLTALRKRCGWTEIQLARAARVSTTIISWYESGSRVPRYETLLRLALVMGYSAQDVDALLFGVEAFVGPAEIPPQAAGLSRETLIEIRREAIQLARVQEVRRIAEARAAAAERARGEADQLVRELAAQPLARRQAAIDSRFELRTWAGVERLAHESEREAANDPWQAIEWAELSLRTAGLIQDKRERKRLLGYAWAYVANARRVTSDLRGADQAFAFAWAHWKAGRKAGWCPVEEWRLSDLEASLRRDQRDCRKAMALHRRVLAVVPGEHRGRALLKMAKTYETDGDLERAIPCLREAEPFIDPARDPRLRFAYRLNLAGYLALCGRVAEAEAMMPEARALAIQLRNGIELTRTLWVQSWIDLAAGRMREAINALDLVRKDLCARRLAYDAALATLELAVLLLEDGEYDRVRELATEIFWVFASRQIRKEALASLKIFYDAAKRDELTVALTRRVLAEVREAGRTPESPG